MELDPRGMMFHETMTFTSSARTYLLEMNLFLPVVAGKCFIRR